MKEEQSERDTRRYVASGAPNIQRLIDSDHESAKKGPLYLLVKRNGKRFKRSLETSDLAEAKKRAKVLLELIKAEKWTELQGVRTRQGWASMQEIYDAYLAAATIKTAKRNVAMMKHLLSLAGKGGEGHTACVLGGHTVWQFQQALVKGATNEVEKARAAISANSILRQARSLFAAGVMPAYKAADLTLPDLDGFMKAPKLKAPTVQYVAPGADILARISKTYPELKASDPGAYAAFLLGAFLGLRNNEVRVAEWAWVEQAGDGQWWLKLATKPHWRSKTSRGRDVHIPAGVLEALRSVRGVVIEGVKAEETHLVPAHHATERNARVFRRLNAWLRKQGLDEASFPKGFYELRKHFTNLAAWGEGTYRAARIAGNSPAVVERYYSESSGRAPISIPAPKATEPEKKP